MDTSHDRHDNQDGHDDHTGLLDSVYGRRRPRPQLQPKHTLAVGAGAAAIIAAITWWQWPTPTNAPASPPSACERATSFVEPVNLDELANAKPKKVSDQTRARLLEAARSTRRLITDEPPTTQQALARVATGLELIGAAIRESDTSLYTDAIATTRTAVAALATACDQ